MSTTITQIINEERERQIKGIELIASENFVHPDVLTAMGSCLTNKYAEGYPGKRYYGGCSVVDKIENLCRDYAKELFECEHANVQPHSGSQANMAVFMSIMEPGDKFLGFSLDAGGHLTHGSPVNFSGKLYKALSYGLDENGYVDYKEMARIAITEKPKIIMGGASAYSREWDYKTMREIADMVGAILVIDIAHTAGLIAAGLLNNPAEYAHILTSTTHKTLRGPRGGLILIPKDFENPKGETNKAGKVKMMSEMIDFTVFPGIQGGPLEHIIAAKAVAFEQALSDDFKKYAKQVIGNSKALAEHLIKKGYTIVSGGTDNHCFLVDLRSKFPDMTGATAQAALDFVDITVNKNMVNKDTRSPFQTSGIRIGTPAITTRGLKTEDMKTVADFIDEALSNHDKQPKLDKIRVKVNKLMINKPHFTWD